MLYLTCIDGFTEIGIMYLIYLVVYPFLYLINILLSKSYSSNPLICKLVIYELVELISKFSNTIFYYPKCKGSRKLASIFSIVPLPRFLNYKLIGII